jgi:4,5-dihydroxyphthalate decarboxylase
VKISFASGRYDRMDALHNGAVGIDGIELEHIELWPPRLIFDRMAGSQAFDVAEFSCSEYISQVDRGDCPFIALPVFPSRVFRHGFICVRRGSGVRTPKDLEDRRIGVPLYTQTAAIWIRGMLQSDHGVDFSGVRWLEGAVMEAGGHGQPSAPPMHTPPPIEANRTGRPLAELLLAGEIDAILGTFVDDACRAHHDIVRLFPDYRARERDYFRRTGIFPMMHLVVIRKDVHARHPSVARKLFDAMVAAKSWARRELLASNAQRYMLPWLLDDVNEVDEVFGGDAWPYGIEANRPTLEALGDYMLDQGFIARRIPLEELFLPFEPAG